MSIELHFLRSHLAKFLENLGAVSDEEDEQRFENNRDTVSEQM